MSTIREIPDGNGGDPDGVFTPGEVIYVTIESIGREQSFEFFGTIEGNPVIEDEIGTLYILNDDLSAGVYNVNSFFTLPVCFLPGTLITTLTGETAVEALQPGAMVVTADGAPEPVLWVGRRRVRLAGRPDAAEMAPIRIAAGALAAGVPRRDLLVSPDHCLFLDGALVPARLLVNGTTITSETGHAEVTWFHVELPRHAVLLAEGAPAESWLDCGNRAWFANAPVAALDVKGNLDTAGTGWDATRACAPVLHGGERLAAIRASIAMRAEDMMSQRPLARLARPVG
jgi:hypothetical protein